MLGNDEGRAAALMINDTCTIVTSYNMRTWLRKNRSVHVNLNSKLRCHIWTGGSPTETLSTKLLSCTAQR